MRPVASARRPSAPLVALFALAALVAAPACGDLLDPAAAVVYDDKIPIEAVQVQLDRHVESPSFEQLAAQGDAGALKRGFEQDRLTDLIMRAVLTPAAEERGIEITEEDVQTRFEEFLASEFDGNTEQLEEALNEQGLTESQFRDVIHDQILHDSLRADVAGDVRVTEEQVRAFYEENSADFESTRAQHVLVEDRGLAEQLAARLQGAPEANVDDLFATLARQHSIDPSAKRTGGDLGYQPAGTFVPPFEEAVAALEVGEVSDPVETRFGWHVIRVTGRRVTPLEDVAEDIESQLLGPAQDEVWNEFLDGLIEEADVRVNPRYGIFDVELRQVVDPGAEDIPGGEAPAPDDEPSPPTIPIPAPPPPG
jgi:foldase protein PrsA